MKKNNKMGRIIKTTIFAFILQLSFFITSVNAEIINIGDSQSFDYTGDYQEFTAPYTGYYKVQLWGAQGGTAGGAGGKGAYTSGIIQLNKDETIYIYTGERVSSYVNRETWNGGGRGSTGSNESNNANGGGATDVRLVNGNWNNSSSLASRIMVAAGGGGGTDYGSDAAGGAGGALVGLGGGKGTNSGSKTIKLSTGGTQTQGGLNATDGTQSISGSFGQGGTGTSYSGSYIYRSGGGGGYYGGGAGGNGSSVVGSAAGGSSYISGYKGSVAITSADDLTPRNNSNGAICADGTTDITCSYHYSGKIFEEPTMIAGNASMPTHDGTSTMTGNAGNGYAKITYLGSGDATLESLTVTGKELTPSFQSDITEYNLTLTKEDESIEINAVPTDENATASYNQNPSIKYGISTQEIIVTSEAGTINIYTITINKRLPENENVGFDYTGAEETFIAPDTGLYKLETWGAQGGTNYI